MSSFGDARLICLYFGQVFQAVAGMGKKSHRTPAPTPPADGQPKRYHTRATSRNAENQAGEREAQAAAELLDAELSNRAAGDTIEADAEADAEDAVEDDGDAGDNLFDSLDDGITVIQSAHGDSEDDRDEPARTLSRRYKRRRRRRSSHRWCPRQSRRAA